MPILTYDLGYFHVHVLQARIYIAILYAKTPDNKTHAPYHKTTALLPTMHRFIRTKLSRYTTHRSVFSINRLRYY